MVKLEYIFKDQHLYRQALTHTSRRKEKEASSFERLEFLGDRVLGLVIAEWLYECYPTAEEGILAKHYTYLVNRDTLAKIAQTIDLGSKIEWAPSKKAMSTNVLGDALESLIGAIYIDGGLQPAREFIRSHWATFFEKSAFEGLDPKSQLQEWSQASMKKLPSYKVLSRKGPDHDPEFKVQVNLPDGKSAIAKGPSKRQAEQEAARALLKEISDDDKHI